MKEKSRLLVMWEERLVGTLTRRTRGRLVFQYGREWLDNIARPISFSLPCQAEAFAPAVSTAFFENLLPESNTRTILAFNHRFDQRDTFAFLENFGEDCAGALSIIPEEKKPDFTPGQYACIDKELIKALDNITEDPRNFTLFTQMENARLSIAGAQDKLPVYIGKKGRFFLPITSGSATTHIIKPVNTDFTDLPKNEAFCMELAGLAGLPTPESRLVRVGGHELFVVDRYDREISSKKVRRIHQEDFCQAMGLPSESKYQESGGPGFLQCRQLIDEFLPAQSVEARINFSNAMIFNFIIGNRDAHGKNFSIVHHETPSLAPFYDLVSTQVYPLTSKFAMAIGNTFRHDRIKEHAFKEFARHMNLRWEKVFALIEQMCTSVSDAYLPLLADNEKKYGKAKIYDDLEKVIKENLERLGSIAR